MATNTTLQYLETTGEDAFGASVELGATVSNRRQVETFLAGGAITALTPVKLDTSATGAARAVTVVASGSADDPAVGIALAAASSGDRVEVVIAGYVENIACAAGVATGDFLKSDNATVSKATVGTNDLFGVALEAVADGTVDMVVFKRF